MIAAVTTLLAALFAALLFNQYAVRRAPYQLAWAIGATAFAVAAGAESAAQLAGWSEPLYRVWYLTGAVWTAGWLGAGTILLLAKTRFGYWYALCLALAGLFTILVARRLEDPSAGPTALGYALAAWVTAVVIAWLTYLASPRWSRAAIAFMVALSALALPLVATATLPAPGWAVDPMTGAPVAVLLPPSLRLLTPLLNVSGALALLTGALFSAYVFMPKRRTLPYSSDPNQRGDELLFNLAIAPVALTVNFFRSLPLAMRAWREGTLNRRVSATLLIALGAFLPSLTDTLNRGGSTEAYALGKLLGAALLLLGFLASVEEPSEISLPIVGAPLRAVLRWVRE
ncbi:MAG: hypothetical protein ACO3GP_06610 [Candidatus Limnocylindrus sp.]